MEINANPIHKAQGACRCAAKAKRTGLPCKAPAVRGWNVCRMHGAGGGAPRGKGNGMWQLRVVEMDIAHWSLLQVKGRVEAVGPQHVADAPVEAFGHAMGLRMVFNALKCYTVTKGARNAGKTIGKTCQTIRPPAISARKGPWIN